MKVPIFGLAILLIVVLIEAKLSEDDFDNDDMTPCPRDCTCDGDTARCRLIDSDFQQFGSHIKSLVVHSLDNKYPIILDNYIFENAGLRSVNKIQIINSNISEIHPFAFGNLTYLTSVELRNNDLKSINPNLFITNLKLKTIKLCDNPIEHAYENLLTAPFLEEIVICNSKITHLNETTFLGLPNAVYIDLSNNLIENIHMNSLVKLQNLEELDLSNNMISTIPTQLFIANSELSILRLVNNPLKSAQQINSETLETLDLSMCLIETITNEMFTDVPNLIDLKLSSNKLKKIEVKAFERLEELFDIDLSNNNLTEIQPELFSNNIELNAINLNNNPGLKELPSRGFVTKNNVLPITNFDLSNCGIDKLTEYTFVTMPTLTSLFLNGNKIRQLPNKIFYELRSLKDLDLSNNQIEVLHAKVFETNRNLHSLNLSKNPLKQIFDTEFINLQNLVTLDLSNCQLSEFNWLVPDNKLDRLTSMKVLNISNNQFKTIRADQLDMVPYLRELDLTNNPLACNKEFASLIQWLISHNVQIPHSDPTHLPSKQMLTKSNGANDQKLRWNQLARSVCKDKPIEQVTEATTESHLTQTRTGKTAIKANGTTDSSVTYYYYYDDDDYDESQYDQSTISDANNFDIELEEAEEVKSTLLKYANYTNVLMFLIGAITSSTIVFIIAYLIRVYRNRRPSNVFIATLAAARTRTDCGLVYKPLSEEKIAPKSSSMLSRLYEPYLNPNHDTQTKAYREISSNENMA